VNLARRLLLHDWRRKLLAVLLAFALWWYVDGLIAVDRSYSLRVVPVTAPATPEEGTLTVLVPPGWTLVEPQPGTSVALRLHGSRSNLENFTSRQFAAFHELRQPAPDAVRSQQSEDVDAADVVWRRPDEAAQLLAAFAPTREPWRFRLERETEEVFELRHELLRIESEVREEYEVASLDARFELSQATLSGPQRLVEQAVEEIRRAMLAPGSGAALFQTIRLPQSTRLDAVVMLQLDPSWRTRGLRMDPDWVRVSIPVRLRLNSVHVWTPALQVVSDPRWQAPAYAAPWKAEMRYDVLDPGVPFKEWIEQHLMLFLPLPLVRGDGQDLAEARVEWTLVGVDPARRADLLGALVVGPVDPDGATVIVTRVQ
jgi:hypothetical protein